VGGAEAGQAPQSRSEEEGERREGPRGTRTQLPTCTPRRRDRVKCLPLIRLNMPRSVAPDSTNEQSVASSSGISLMEISSVAGRTRYKTTASHLCYTSHDTAQLQIGVKLKRVFFPRCDICTRPFPCLRLHWFALRDSRNLVDPFMRVNNWLTRHLATLRES